MTTTNNKQQATNQSKEWQRELRELKAQARDAERNLEELRDTCAAEQKRIRLDYREQRRALDSRTQAAFREIFRSQAREERSAKKVLTKLARRIGILEGRLS